jgi:hypothetical protein
MSTLDESGRTVGQHRELQVHLVECSGTTEERGGPAIDYVGLEGKECAVQGIERRMENLVAGLGQAQN